MCAMNVLVPNDEQLISIDQADAFRLIADFTYDCEMWLGPNRKLLYISPSYERITGYHPLLRVGPTGASCIQRRDSGHSRRQAKL